MTDCNQSSSKLLGLAGRKSKEFSRATFSSDGELVMRRFWLTRFSP
jgi:hypothetical protein